MVTTTDFITRIVADYHVPNSHSFTQAYCPEETVYTMTIGALRSSLPRLIRRNLQQLTSSIRHSSTTSGLPAVPKQQDVLQHVPPSNAVDRFVIPAKLTKAQKVLGYEFKTPEILWESLQAPGSDVKFLNDRQLPEGNKPLAGIGDKVFALIAVLDSYDRGDNVGATNSLLLAHVGNFRLATICDDSGLTACINQNPSSRGFVSPRTKADTIEAVIGAAYRDGGLEAARLVMKRLKLL
ncbi:hypothetical protein F5X99DRAFT_249078 [Biscogniauxia marginata]|nr:hypothetical protein F5X99DRAFT_249078 [Biscogniauxia marginata]